jgi:hypothetical protein
LTGQRWASVALLLVAAAALMACGEATDQPEDCRPGEYFNEANESCDACPAIVEPQCSEGCGFKIVGPEEREDLRCPIAECQVPSAEGDSCACLSGQFFDDDTLSCESCGAVIDPPMICDGQGDQEDDS